MTHKKLTTKQEDPMVAVDLESASHYGESLLYVRDRTKAICCARALVDNAADRTT